MLGKFLRIRKWHLLFAGLVWLAFSACRDNRLKKVDVSGIPLTLDIQRFENDLFADLPDSVKIALLKKKYGSFYNLYCKYIVKAGTPADPATTQYLREFYANVDIKSLYADVHQQYDNIAEIQAGLENAFKHYKYYFPDKPVPRVLTFISGFNFNIITDSSLLGLGLDMYLGRDYKHYRGIELPMYKIARMQRAYLVADALKGFAQVEFPFDEFKSQNLLAQMIYYGKQWYLLDALMPDMADTLKTGFTAKQQKWCGANEANLWGYFVEHKMLFSTDPDKYMRYITDGPTTNGLPKDSPSMLGVWLGYKIVQAYMTQHKEVTVAQLMKNADAQGILNESKYKP